MYVGMDIGTSSVKAALLFPGGEVDKLTKEYKGSDNIQNNNLYVEKSVDSLEESVRKLFKKIKNRYDNKVKAIGFCGHGPSLLLVDINNNPLTDIVMWQDRRAVKEVSLLKNRLSFNKDATSYEAKVTWFAKNMPEIIEKTSKILYPKDYIIALLCREKIIDSSTASTIDFYKGDGNWEVPLKDISEEIFPEVKDSWARAGKTGTEFSENCGLSENIPIYSGGIDSFCEAVGAGGIEFGDLVEGTGTSTCLSLCTGPEKGVSHVIPNRGLETKVMTYTGGSLSWGLNLISESYNFLATIDENKPCNLLFLPYLLGERSPIWDERAAGAIVGLKEKTTKEQIVKSIMQGVAFGIRQNLESFNSLNQNKDKIRAVGGGAKSGKWLQIKADITEKKYLQMSYKNSASLGAALIAVYGENSCKDLREIIDMWVKVEDEFAPNEKNYNHYQELYEVYGNLYYSLQEHFHKIDDLGR